MIRPSWTSWCLLACAIAGSGCAVTDRYLVFMTRTKFGLDISQRPDQPVEVTMGYQRTEIASIPAPTRDEHNQLGCGDATLECDTHSVLGTFHVSYDAAVDFVPPMEVKPLQIKSFFATGFAAQKAAKNKDFAKALLDRARENAKEGE